MMWQTASDRLALLELLTCGMLTRRSAQGAAWDLLAELPWTKHTTRRNQLGLIESRRPELVSLLDRVWPEWGEALAALTAQGQPPTPKGWTALQDAQRASTLPALAGQLNRRTAAALTAPHSKAALTERRLAALGDIAPMHDGSVRLRPPVGLTARTSRGAINLSAIASVLGEVSLPERAFEAGLELDGPIRAVLLIENLGAFCDLPSLDGWLYVHVAGWDTATTERLLQLLAHAPVIHFGDIDPNGVRIYQHLRSMREDLRWFLPPFWVEALVPSELRACWPEDLDLTAAPELVRLVASRNAWLEQESMVVDARTLEALKAILVEKGTPA